MLNLSLTKELGMRSRVIIISSTSNIGKNCIDTCETNDIKFIYPPNVKVNLKWIKYLRVWSHKDTEENIGTILQYLEL